MVKKIEIEPDKFEYIDAIRGVAVLGTLMVHCSIYEHGINNYGDIFKRITFFGANGVQLFFIMSALTLCLSARKRNTVERYSTINFFVRRFFRIAPLFYFSIAMSLILYGFGQRYWLGSEPSVTLANLISTITFTNSINAYWINSIVEGGWSIAIEMVFYLIFPFLYKYINTQKKAIWLLNVSLIISSIIFHWLLQSQIIPDMNILKGYSYFIFTSQLPVFLLGINLYYFLVDSPNIKTFFIDNASSLYCFILILISNILFGFLQEHILISLCFALIVVLIAQCKTKLIVNNFLQFLGKLSYSMYLTHFAMLYFMWKIGLLDLIDMQMVNFFLRFSILIFLTVCVSYITHISIEKPGIQCGKWIISKLNNN